MLLVDESLLELSICKDSPWQTTARDFLRELVRGKAPWAMPWFAIAEFMHFAVTDPEAGPLGYEQAARLADVWVAAPSLRLLSASARTFSIHRELSRLVPTEDERLLASLPAAALCVEHGIERLITLGIEEPRSTIGAVTLSWPSLS